MSEKDDLSAEAEVAAKEVEDKEDFSSCIVKQETAAATTQVATTSTVETKTTEVDGNAALAETIVHPENNAASTDATEDVATTDAATEDVAATTAATEDAATTAAATDVAETAASTVDHVEASASTANIEPTAAATPNITESFASTENTAETSASTQNIATKEDIVTTAAPTEIIATTAAPTEIIATAVPATEDIAPIAAATAAALAAEDKDAAVDIEEAVAEAANIATAMATAIDATATAKLPKDHNEDLDMNDDDDGANHHPTIEVDAAAQCEAANNFMQNSKRHSDVRDRDVVINNREDNLKMFLFLEDLVHMYNVLWQLQDSNRTPTEEDYDQAAKHIVKLLKTGKKYELGGLRDVPRPFLKSRGRILEREGELIKEISEGDALRKIRKMLVEKVKKDSLEERVKESPYREFKRRLERNAQCPSKGAVQVESGDAILTNCIEQERELEQQGESKVVFNIAPQQVLFNLAAQIVTTYTINSETQIKAAITILNGLDETDFPSMNPDGSPALKTPINKHSRFLLRDSSDNNEMLWNLVSEAEVLEFAVTFVFEVHIEKDLDYITSMIPFELRHSSTEDQSKVPVKLPNEYDVLFGRGGMTNSHVGNRRFRDIIALHRPDYIRAIKMDKPAVARKIVKGIRYGNPPGRFLKKSDDGNWYDVGDRTAAEKTSQGLRERTNAEKRQRSQLRRALRLRKEDMEEDDESEASSSRKRAKTAAAVEATTPDGDAVKLAASLAPTLNYVGTNIAVPLSLNMGAHDVPHSRRKSETSSSSKNKSNSLGLNTEGLPPNAVDAEGNILVTDYDILLGRGGLTNHHKGNKRFRDIVALHRPDYVRAPKIQKPSVARVIVRAIRNGDPPGRFLRKDEKTGKWFDVGDKKAAEKTSQALREKASEERGKLEPGSAGILVPSPASYLAATAANVMGNILAAGTFTGSENEERKEDKNADDAVKNDPLENNQNSGTAEDSKVEVKESEQTKERELTFEAAVEV